MCHFRDPSRWPRIPSICSRHMGTHTWGPLFLIPPFFCSPCDPCRWGRTGVRMEEGLPRREREEAEPWASDPSPAQIDKAG